MHQTVLDEYTYEMKKSPLPDVDGFKNSQNPQWAASLSITLFRGMSSATNGAVLECMYLEITNIKKGTQHVLFSLKEKKLNKVYFEKQSAERRWRK